MQCDRIDDEAEIPLVDFETTAGGGSGLLVAQLLSQILYIIFSVALLHFIEHGIDSALSEPFLKKRSVPDFWID